MKKELKIINFSNGIRSTEIQHNFNALQEQLNKERVSVAGAGISYGLNFELKDFKLKISEGCLIDSQGEEIYTEETIIDVEKPILLEKVENALVVDSYNRLFLEELPYANNRMTISENVDVKESGVICTLTGLTGSAANVSIASIEQNVLHINTNSSLKNSKIDVTYNYTYKRRDIVFIDKEFNIQYRTGITSPSPSVPYVSPSEASYILGYIEVDGLAINDSGEIEATAKFIKEFKSVRNIYTDKDNTLYLCGTPFDSIKVIHMVEPKDPEEYTLWYDEAVNKLKIWRHTDKYEFVDVITFESSDPNHPKKFKTNIKYKYNADQIAVYINNVKLSKSQFEEGTDLSELQKEEAGIFSQEFKILAELKKGDVISYRITRYDGYAEWVSINDSSYVTAEERFIWSADYLNNLKANKEHDFQHFFFDSSLNRNMLFTPGKNSLSVMIDQIPLHSDQFVEITANDAIASENSEEIKRKLVNYYGYKEDFNLTVLNEEYENIGLGFKLDAPLLNACFVEARVTHKINANPLTKRFQRTATFVSEGGAEYKKYINSEYQDPVFNTETPFRYKENQLEVFLNGVRLERGVEFVELAEADDLQGATINSFEILSKANIKDGDKVTYKVTTTIYSYDHLEGLLSGFETRINDMQNSVSYCVESVDNLITKVNEYTNDINEKMDSLTNIEDTFDEKYLQKTSLIGKDNLESSLYNGIANGSFYNTFTIEANNKKLDITDICSNDDFVILMNVSGNRMLCKGSDYNITEENGYIFLNITTSSVVNGDHLYLSGIKFNRA